MAISAEEYDFHVKVQGADDTTYTGAGCINDMDMTSADPGRKVTRKKSPNCPDERVILGAKSYGNGFVTYEYNPTATAGAAMLKAAYNDKSSITIKQTLDDGTTFVRDAKVSNITKSPEEDEWVEKVSLEYLGDIIETAGA